MVIVRNEDVDDENVNFVAGDAGVLPLPLPLTLPTLRVEVSDEVASSCCCCFIMTSASIALAIFSSSANCIIATSETSAPSVTNELTDNEAPVVLLATLHTSPLLLLQVAVPSLTIANDMDFMVERIADGVVMAVVACC